MDEKFRCNLIPMRPSFSFLKMLKWPEIQKQVPKAKTNRKRSVTEIYDV